jgi:hypothetical protein
VLVGVDLWVVVPDPARVLGLCEARVQLDLGPVGDLEELGVGEAHFLGAGVADEAMSCVVSIVRDWEGFGGSLPVAHVSLNRFGNLVLSGELQARCDGDGILDGLGGTVAGRRQECVCSVTDLDHARGG